MLLKWQTTQYLSFTTHNPVSGDEQDADSMPTATVYVDGSYTSMYTPTVIKLDDLTGAYSVKLVLTSANGFEVERTYNVIATAIVDTITAKARVGQFTFYEDTVDQAPEYYRERVKRGSKDEVWRRVKP